MDSHLSLSRPPASGTSLFSQPSPPKQSTNPYQLNNSGQPSSSSSANPAADHLKTLSSRPSAARSYSLNAGIASTNSTASQTDPQSSNGTEKPTSSSKFDPKDDLIQDLQSDIAKLTKCVTCVICQDLLFEPYSLSCGHIFCYTCLNDWLKHKKTCPECRSKVELRPAPAYLIRDMIETIVFRIELQSPHDEGQALRKQQAESLQAVERDKKSEAGLFQGLFNRRRGRAIIDSEDGILRCPTCNWEIEDMRCDNCGRTFERDELPGMSDLSDSELSDSDSDDDSEDDEDEDTVHDHVAIELTDDDDDMPGDLSDHYLDHIEHQRLGGALEDLRVLAHDMGAIPYSQRGLGGSRRRQRDPWSIDSDEDGIPHDEDFDDEDDSDDLDGFIARDDESLSTSRSHRSPISISSMSSPADQRILDQRRQLRRQIISDDDDDDDDEDEDASSVSDIPQRSSRRNNRYYSNRNPIVISSDNDEEEGLIPEGAGYAQLEHDTTGEEDDEDEGVSDNEPVAQQLGDTPSSYDSRGTATTATTATTASRMSSEGPAARTTRRRIPARNVRFAVPDDADEEEDDSDLERDVEGDLDMDRHSRGGSEPLQEIPTNGRRRAQQANNSTTRSNNSNSRQTRSGARTGNSNTASGSHSNRRQHHQTLDDDGSSDDSLPVQRRRRVIQTSSGHGHRSGQGSGSSSRRHHHSHRPVIATASSRTPTNRGGNRMDANVRRLLGMFHQQRTDQQFEQLGRAGVEAADGGLGRLERSVSPIGGNSNASSRHGLHELNDPVLISSDHHHLTSVTPPPRASLAQSASLSALSSSAPTQSFFRRDASIASPSMSPPPSAATISSVASPEPAPFEFQQSSAASSTTSRSGMHSPASTTSQGSSSLDQRLLSPPAATRMRRRSNLALNNQGSNSRLRETAQTRAQNSNRAQQSRSTGRTVNDEERQQRVQQVLQQREQALGLATRARNRDVQAAAASNNSHNNNEVRRLTRSGTAPSAGNSQSQNDLTLQQRFQHRRADSAPSRDSLTPTPTASARATSEATSNGGSPSSSRTDNTSASSRPRRAAMIGSSPSGGTGGPLWVIND